MADITLKEISDLLDKKLDEKLKPIHDRLTSLEVDMKIVKHDIKEILKHVPVGNNDLESKLPKLQQA